MSEPREMWAFVRPNGGVLADPSFRDPDEAWRMGLDWPTGREVEQAKRQGFKVVKVRVVEVEE